MRITRLVLPAVLLLAACAVRLGGPSPLTYRIVAVPAHADGSPADVGGRLTAEGAQLALIAADRDSAWFSGVASAAGLELSGPGTTGPRGLAFLSSLPILGDTSIVLLPPAGGRIHMHDALFEISEDRVIDLMLIDPEDVTDVRDAVRTLLSYIASDVGNSVPLVLAVSGPATAVDDSVAVLLRAAFANAGDCATEGERIVIPGLRLLYGPPALVRCEDVRVLPDGAGVSAELVIGGR